MDSERAGENQIQIKQCCEITLEKTYGPV